MKKLVLFLLLVTISGCASQVSNIEKENKPRIRYEEMFETEEKVKNYEAICEEYPSREVTEDLCYEYNVNQSIKEGLYTKKEAEQIVEDYYKEP